MIKIGSILGTRMSRKRMFGINMSCIYTHRSLSRESSRYFSGKPWETNYYEVVTDDMDMWLGEKRVESSKIEAIMRRISQKLFLYDSAQRAMLEQEIADDEFEYLSRFVDARDVAPRSKPISQTKLSKQLRSVLDLDHPSLLTDVAKIFWEHQISRTSTYQMVARRVLELGHAQAAQFIMESVLMGHRQGAKLNTSTFTLCLELAMTNNDKRWFTELSKRIEAPENEWRSLQRKFTVIDDHPAVQLMLAEGFMKFRQPEMLDQVLARNRSKPFYIRLLAVNIEAAYRWNDEERAARSFAEFEQMWDPRRLLSTRILRLALKIPQLKERALDLARKLTKSQQHWFNNLTSIYHHPYAN